MPFKYLLFTRLRQTKTYERTLEMLQTLSYLMKHYIQRNAINEFANSNAFKTIIMYDHSIHKEKIIKNFILYMLVQILSVCKNRK